MGVRAYFSTSVSFSFFPSLALSSPPSFFLPLCPLLTLTLSLSLSVLSLFRIPQGVTDGQDARSFLQVYVRVYACVRARSRAR